MRLQVRIEGDVKFAKYVAKQVHRSVQDVLVANLYPLTWGYALSGRQSHAISR